MASFPDSNKTKYIENVKATDFAKKDINDDDMKGVLYKTEIFINFLRLNENKNFRFFNTTKNNFAKKILDNNSQVNINYIINSAYSFADFLDALGDELFIFSRI